MSFKFSIPVVIFAGGKSSRMGEDKSLLPFGGFSSLCEYQHHRLSAFFENVYISCKSKNKFDFKAEFIEDKLSELSSPLVGLLSVLETLQSCIIISVDTPFISQQTLESLVFSKEKVITIEHEPLCGKYDALLLPQITQMIQDNIHKIGLLISNFPKIPKQNDDEFMNLNYKTDYEKALTRIS